MENKQNPEEEQTPTGDYNSNFDFSEGTVSEDEIMIDSQDHTDYADKERKTQLRKVVGIVAAVVGALALGLVFTVLTMNEDTKEIPVENVTTVITPENGTDNDNDTVQPQAPQKNPNPLLNSNPNAPKAKTSEVTVEISKSTVKSTDGNQLNINGAQLTEPQTKCTVNNTNEFCLAGYAKLQDKKVDIYYLKDAAHSRLFENAENFQKIDILGSATAGSMDIKLNDNKTIIAIANKDSSGYMIVLPDNNPETITTISNAITVS